VNAGLCFIAEANKILYTGYRNSYIKTILPIVGKLVLI